MQYHTGETVNIKQKVLEHLASGGKTNKELAELIGRDKSNIGHANRELRDSKQVYSVKIANTTTWYLEEREQPVESIDWMATPWTRYSNSIRIGMHTPLEMQR